MKTIFLLGFLLTILACNKSNKQIDLHNTENKKPNIIVFYVDDLGYGDLSCYGATSVQTPNVDKLAKNGIRYTDAHSASATCTPSRYSLLTGQHAFRENAQILPGDAPLLIDPETPTLPKMLQRAGYKTAVIGKWHLGLGNGDVDWNGEIKPGPLEIGFDYSFLLPSTGDRVPTIYLENYRAVNLEKNDSIRISYKVPFPGEPTGIKNPEMLRQAADPQHSNAIVNGISRIGYQTGGKSALWKDEDFPNIFTKKAKKFMNDHKEQPFFMFFSFHDIHVPRLPNDRFKGKTNMGPRGDAIVQMDWITGVIIQEIERLSLDDNTLIIFTSDNGPVLNDGYEDNALEMLGSHKPAGPFKGGKYSAFEAGTRVPMITYWPKTITPGVSNALISQVDYYASLANLIDQDLVKNEAIDSKDVKQALLSSKADARKILLEESFTLALRTKQFKYIKPLRKNKRPLWITKDKKIQDGFSTKPQLYDLSEDIGEKNNIAEKHQDIIERMEAKIDSIVNIN